MTTLAPIADRLGKLLRLLTSTHDGEVIAAARGIVRVLSNAGLDIHTLAKAVESNGVNNREAAHASLPSWHDIACECEANQDKLSERERTFVSDMVRWTVLGGEPTEKQQKWLRSIYVRVQR
jgi:hypothetical protein